jgi:hypothetical protein
MRIPRLQSLANGLLSRPSCTVDVGKAFQILRAAKDLDCELINWAGRIPIKWSYTTITRMRHSLGPQFSSSNFIPNQIHRYPNFYVSSCVYLQPAEHDQGHIENINRIMVEDVCASVPFLLGYNLSELRSSNDSLQDENFLWPQSSINKASSSMHTGKFSLIWPLYIACSVLSVPEMQRRWMRAQLRWITKTGEAQALFVQDAESQTLMGGPESFRFDCV